jgi:hypothetical protein
LLWSVAAMGRLAPRLRAVPVAEGPLARPERTGEREFVAGRAG